MVKLHPCFAPQHTIVKAVSSTGLQWPDDRATVRHAASTEAQHLHSQAGSLCTQHKLTEVFVAISMWEFWRSKLSQGKTRHKRRDLDTGSDEDSPSTVRSMEIGDQMMPGRPGTSPENSSHGTPFGC